MQEHKRGSRYSALMPMTGVLNDGHVVLHLCSRKLLEIVIFGSPILVMTL